LRVKMNFNYYMPVKIFKGPLGDYADEFAGYGPRALIVTDKSSSVNGALGDVLRVLGENSIEAEVFDRAEENPSVENVTEAARTYSPFKPDFVIGIGGGSPLDAAKAAALMLNDESADENSFYYPKAFPNGAKPVLAIPTTAGTGSEATPFAILTRRGGPALGKSSIPHLVYPEKAFLNPAYTATMPEQIAVNTAIDALCHLAEGYLSNKASAVSDMLAIGGITAFGLIRDRLTEKNFNEDVRAALLSVSTVAGMTITHTKTSLPHQMGYALTFYHGVHHGAACGVLLAEYIRFHPDKKKTGHILEMLGLQNSDEMKTWIDGLIKIDVTLSDGEIEDYSADLANRIGKTGTFPTEVFKEDFERLYRSI